MPPRFAVLLIVACGAPVRAEMPLFSIAGRTTVDMWDNAAGGVRRGGVALGKLQVSGTLKGELIGLPGWSVHAQMLRTDGGSLSARVGDIQTVSNIEAPATYRLFESWLERRFGDAGWIALRGGLMDLNADFDANDTSSLFINSSHGIGADIARSGENGPSIFPVTSLGTRLGFSVSDRWSVKLGVYDGVPGDPDHPRRFVSAKLRPGDGALLIGETNYRLTDDATLQLGGWRYSKPRTAILGRFAGDRGHDQGLYGSIAAPIPRQHGWTAWLRAGIAARKVQTVSSYMGAGVVMAGLLPGRPEDRFGLAIARAGIGGPARTAQALPRAETTIEVTYQAALRRSIAVQPDLQYVMKPAGQPGARNALVLGLRVVIVAGYPERQSAIQASDPTVPPDAN